LKDPNSQGVAREKQRIPEMPAEEAKLL